MRPPPFFQLLVFLGRTGLPEIIISAFVFYFARTLHSLVLTVLAALLLWPGLVHFFDFVSKRGRPPRDN
jgi:hypothetical protein